MSFGVPVRNGVGIGIASAASLRSAAGGLVYPIVFTNGALPANVTASGGANGTRVNSSGYVAATSAPRFDYSPTSVGTSLGILVEAARQNLFTYSEQLDNAAWVKSGLSITPNATTSPANDATADFVIPSNTATTFKQAPQSASYTLGQSYAYSFYAKAGTYRYVQIITSAAPFGSGSVNYDLQTGTETAYTASNWSLVSKSITDAGNGWYRISIVLTCIATGSGNIAFNPIPANNSARGVSWAGDGTSGFYVWGQQLENAATASTYIPTSTPSLTRSADAVSFVVSPAISTLTYTFDDNSTQAVSVSPGAYTIPTNLNRPRIKSIAGS